MAGVVAALTLVPAALAGNVVLWACHGPAGQPLGLGPFVAASAADGVTATYGSGCSGSGGDAGGLEAGFGRPDPAGGSAAGWRVSVPAGTALTSLALDRATSGFGGLPLPGDPLSYRADTSAGPLESASVADASNVALSGHASFPGAVGIDAGFSVACAAAAGARCAAPSAGTVGVRVSAVALGVSDTDPPRGAVGGVQNPVTGPLPLYLRATDSGLGLVSATATLEGEPPVTVQFGGPSCAPLASSSGELDVALGADCPTSVTDVPMTVSTADVADGNHHLTVTLTNIAGITRTLVDQDIGVVNHLVVAGSSVLLSIGSGGGRPGGSAGSGPGGGGSAGPPACLSPRLKAALTSRPLRRSSHRVAVLWSKTRYLFTGTLTCLRNGRRVGAPIDTVIDIFSIVGTKVPRRRTEAATYGRRGLFRVLLHPASTRTIQFRYKSGGAQSSVFIPVIVTPRRR